MKHFFLVLFLFFSLSIFFHFPSLHFPHVLLLFWFSFQILDLLSWRLPQLCTPIFPPEILHRCSPVCPSVPLSGCSSTPRCLSGWPGAGPRCCTFFLKLWSERPCCCSRCFISHEWHTVDSDWDFADMNVYNHFYQWYSYYKAGLHLLLQHNPWSWAGWS